MVKIAGLLYLCLRNIIDLIGKKWYNKTKERFLNLIVRKEGKKLNNVKQAKPAAAHNTRIDAEINKKKQFAAFLRKNYAYILSPQNHSSSFPSILVVLRTDDVLSVFVTRLATTLL